MTNKLYDSKGQLIGYIRTVEKNLHDDLTRVILSTGHELVFGPCDLASDRDGNWRIRSGALYPRCEGKKTASATNTAAIKDVIFAPPATIVYWSDGSKTVVKCSEKDVFDPEKGLAMAIAKRCGGNNGSYYKEIRHWVEKSGKKYPGKPYTESSSVENDSLKKYIAQAKNSYEAALEAAAKGNPANFLSMMGRVSAALSILELEINK
nr:MAG: hypothetical protein [Bacteriophage sp.]